MKVWSTNGYTSDQIFEQAQEFVKDHLQLDLTDLVTTGVVRFIFDKLPRKDLLDLYRESDAFVLPSRGEGWGRPYMEAMALGIPTIGTNWSGNTAFMNEGNSFLVDYKLVPVPERGWREISAYRGHQWAEPDIA
ncbi:MAG: glycosyltransferase, partial [Chthonomonadales bacterium]